MSLNIWTQCGASSNERTLVFDKVFRVVESQHVISTRKLVDSDAEHAQLEELLEKVKPPMPLAAPGSLEFEGLHYLLFTPFRHPPLVHGSRFGRRNERGIWYGALALSCAFAEVAYYRFLFLEDTEARLEPLFVELSSFNVPIRTARGIDLRASPFDAYRREWTSRSRYKTCHAIGTSMREAGIDAFVYTSARDPDGQASVGLFTPRAFASRVPKRLETWTSSVTKTQVEVQEKDLLAARRRSWVFSREQFLVRGQLPTAS